MGDKDKGLNWNCGRKRKAEENEKREKIEADKKEKWTKNRGGRKRGRG